MGNIMNIYQCYECIGRVHPSFVIEMPENTFYKQALYPDEQIKHFSYPLHS